jgi:hypothetical protein
MPATKLSQLQVMDNFFSKFNHSVVTHDMKEKDHSAYVNSGLIRTVHDSMKGNTNLLAKKNLINKTFLYNIISILDNYSKIILNNSISNTNKDNTNLGIKEINHLFNFSNKRFLKTFFFQTKTIREGFFIFIKSKESEIKYLLFKLNTLLKKIKYIINIININKKFLIKIDKIKNEIKIKSASATRQNNFSGGCFFEEAVEEKEINNSKLISDNENANYDYLEEKATLMHSPKYNNYIKKDLYSVISK